MKFQTRPWSCGAAAVRNTLRRFGQNVTEASISSVADTDKDGTDENGILAALQHFGYFASGIGFDNQQVAWKWLRRSISSGRAIILCAERWQHWVLAFGNAGDCIIVFDSSNSIRNKPENGVRIWDRDTLMKKWKNDKRLHPDSESKMYAITVKKKKKKRNRKKKM